MKFSDRILACELSPIRKFYPYTQAAQAAGKKIYYLNIGQPDIKTPEPYFDAIRQFTPPVLEYAPSPGIRELLAEICAYYRRIGADYTEADTLVTTSGSEALQFIMLCLLNAGDGVLIPEPFYPNYGVFIKMADGVVQPIPTTAENGYRYADRALIESHITEKTRGILLSNPGNPTGTVLTREEMRLIADIAIERDLFLIADEVYREFIYSDTPAGSFAQFPDLLDRLILVDSISKRFSACGARIGCLLTKNPELYQNVLKLCQARLSSPTIDQVGAAALYRMSPEYFTAIREEYEKRRDVIYRHLQAMEGVVCGKPEGAFYVAVRLPVDDTEAFQMYLLTDYDSRIDFPDRPQETLLYAPGAGFYETPGKGKQEIRLAYVLNADDLTRAMELLASALRQYNRK